MKKLLATLLLVCGAAHAEKWLEMPNEAGGKIILLTGECKAKSNGKLVIATTPSGTNINGCWYYFADMIHIAWDNGKTSSFNLSDFTPRENK